MITRRLLLGLSFASLTLFAHAAAARAENAEPRDQCKRPPLVIRTYHVADLVVARDTDRDPTPREDRLLSLIVRSIAPESWDGVGGLGTVQYFPLGFCLAIRQTEAVHQEVAELLAALRRELEPEIAVEVRVLHVTDEVMGLVRKKECSGVPGILAFLDHNGLKEVLGKAQEDHSARITQAPRVILISGQRAVIRATEETPVVTDQEVCREDGRFVRKPRTQTVESGVMCTVCPVASADRRSVKMRLNLELRSFGGVVALQVGTPRNEVNAEPNMRTQYVVATNVQSVETSFDIPDGGTAVFDAGKTKVERRCDFGSHIASEVSPLKPTKKVSNVSERQNVLVLVTPRVVVNEEVGK